MRAPHSLARPASPVVMSGASMPGMCSALRVLRGSRSSRSSAPRCRCCHCSGRSRQAWPVLAHPRPGLLPPFRLHLAPLRGRSCGRTTSAGAARHTRRQGLPRWTMCKMCPPALPPARAVHTPTPLPARSAMRASPRKGDAAVWGASRAQRRLEAGRHLRRAKAKRPLGAAASHLPARGMPPSNAAAGGSGQAALVIAQCLLAQARSARRSA